jgi:hypothetical protein
MLCEHYGNRYMLCCFQSIGGFIMPTEDHKSSDSDSLDQQVARAVEKQLPHLIKIERYLTVPIVIWGLVSSIGLLGIGAWGAKIVWDQMRDQEVKDAAHSAQIILEAPDGSVTRLSSNVSKIASSLDKTFGSQVDSASFKLLRFGCNLPNIKPEAGFPSCAALAEKGERFRAEQDLTIFFVATPKHQTIKLELSLYPIDALASLEEPVLLLQIYLQPPSVRPGTASSRQPLLLLPADVKSTSEFVQDGRLLLSNGEKTLDAAIDLTRFIDADSSGSTHELRFVAVRADGKEYKEAPGTARFYVESVIFAHHRLDALQAIEKTK